MAVDLVRVEPQLTAGFRFVLPGGGDLSRLSGYALSPTSRPLF